MDARPLSSGSISLKCLARADDFQRKLPLHFVLRQELLTNPSELNEPEHTTSLLLRLPYDILHLLFLTLSHAPSQICLLLTCKRLHLLLTCPSAPPLTLSTHSAKYAGHLPLRIFDVPTLLTQLTPSFPSYLRLCGHCLTFRPCPPYPVSNVSTATTITTTTGPNSGSRSSRHYWHQVRGCGPSCDFWIQKTGWEFYGGGWNKIVHDICPFCHGSCTLGDFGDCDGCSALGRLGDVNWQRLGEAWRRRTVEEQLREGVFAT